MKQALQVRSKNVVNHIEMLNILDSHKIMDASTVVVADRSFLA